MRDDKPFIKRPRISQHELMSRTQRMGDCAIWTGTIKGNGYGRIRMAGRYYATHRLSYELHKGPIPAGLLVMHTCDVRACCNPDHLALGTHADNMADMRLKGRAAKGPTNRRTRLSEEQVQAIRRLYRPKCCDYGNAALARRYGVSPATISYVVHGRHWAHVAGTNSTTA